MGLFGRSEHPAGERTPEDRARARAERERRRAAREGRPVDSAVIDPVWEDASEVGASARAGRDAGTPEAHPATEPGVAVVESGPGVVEPGPAPAVEPSSGVVEPGPAPAVEPPSGVGESGPAPAVEPPPADVESGPAPAVEPSSGVVEPGPAPAVEPPSGVGESGPAPAVEPSSGVVEPGPAPAAEPPSGVVEPGPAPAAEPPSGVGEPGPAPAEPPPPPTAPQVASIRDALRRPQDPIRLTNRSAAAPPIIERGGPPAPPPTPRGPTAGGGDTGEHELELHADHGPSADEHELHAEQEIAPHAEHDLAPQADHDPAAHPEHQVEPHAEHEPVTDEHELEPPAGHEVAYDGHADAPDAAVDPGATAAAAPLDASAPGDLGSPRRPRRPLRRRKAGAPVRRYVPGAVAAGVARRRRGRRSGRIVARVQAGVVLIVLIALLYLANAIFQPFHGAAHGQVEVVIPKGSTARKVGDELARDGVVSSGLFFYLHARLSGQGSTIKPGRYLMARDMSYSTALGALAKGPIVVRTIRITIAPGFDRLLASRRAAADGLRGSYLAATLRSPLLDPRRYGARHAPSLEGFLFPDTFTFAPGSSVKRLVDAQLQAFKRQFARVNLAAARRAHLTPYEVLIIASMVEKEAGTRADAPRVSAVIYNRLRRGIPLGIDATILYGLGGDFTRALTNADLTRDTPYNTRVRKGLPPTPISEPGLGSIQAAAHPAGVPYLYFVAKPGTCGQSVFETSYQQFLRDSKRYRSAKVANGGRSPTQC